MFQGASILVPLQLSSEHAGELYPLRLRTCFEEALLVEEDETAHSEVAAYESMPDVKEGCQIF